MAADTEEATLPAVAEALAATLLAATEAFDAALLAAAVAAADTLEATTPALAPAAVRERAAERRAKAMEGRRFCKGALTTRVAPLIVDDWGNVQIFSVQ
mmetsp:Transcript_142779/g.248980  ORF Transcript_142779/g.248980 Transcript_142779/m.248980 type:complete len:99 (+) Transcript_142779:802-1098(+)